MRGVSVHIRASVDFVSLQEKEEHVQRVVVAASAPGVVSHVC